MEMDEALKAGQKVKFVLRRACNSFLPYMYGLYLHLEHSHSDSSNLIGQFEVSYFHSDTDEGTYLQPNAWAYQRAAPSSKSNAE